MQDGLTSIEEEALGYLQNIQGKFPDVFQDLLERQWLGQGIDEGGRRLLCHISATNEFGTAYAMALSYDPPSADSLPACPS